MTIGKRGGRNDPRESRPPRAVLSIGIPGGPDVRNERGFASTARRRNGFADQGSDGRVRPEPDGPPSGALNRAPRECAPAPAESPLSYHGKGAFGNGRSLFCCSFFDSLLPGRLHRRQEFFGILLRSNGSGSHRGCGRCARRHRPIGEEGFIGRAVLAVNQDPHIQ